YQLRGKLQSNLKVFSVARVLPVGRGGYIHAKVVTTTLNAYMTSADRHLGAHHMKDLNETAKGAFFMTHDGYLKLWQLQEPKPCLWYQYDVIFIDEAQDCNPAIMDVLLAQRCAKVLVGDPHQQIYTFRGAVNALHTAPHTHIFYLTQVCKKVRKILVGGKQEGSVYGESFDAVARVPLAPSPAPAAILSRCNFGVFNEAGIVGVGLSKILDIWRLKQPPHSRSAAIEDPFIRWFGSYNGLQTYVLQSEDRELEAKVAVVEKYAQRVPELAKGLEFDTVMVCDDFARVPCARHHLSELSGLCCKDIPQDEWNLLYVAVTRARRCLEYFQRAEVTGSLLREGLPPRCSASQCLHTIRADAPFTIGP
ncbi:LOW QUALITY PROTEIN: hypothetical protein CRUP_022169, partial [Coryphaenoides rupestris]